MKYCWKFVLFCVFFAGCFHLYLEENISYKSPFDHATFNTKYAFYSGCPSTHYGCTCTCTAAAFVI